MAKTCKKCLVEMPATKEFFYTTKVTKKNGKVFICLRPECKGCSVKAAVEAKHALGDATYQLRRAMGGSKKSKQWMEKNLGYCAGELAIHLERQFTKGMDWFRFFMGEIHIDHIVPIKQFDKTSKKEMVACYHLANLRPVWASANLAKSGKALFLI